MEVQCSFSGANFVHSPVLQATDIIKPWVSFLSFSPLPHSSSCFLSLLLVAAVVWKIKQSCWASRRREVGQTDGWNHSFMKLPLSFVLGVCKGGSKHTAELTLCWCKKEVKCW